MKVALFAKPITALAITLSSTIGFVLLSHSHQQLSSLKSKTRTHSMANSRSFIVWLHGLGDSGPANEPIKSLFTSPEFKNTTWSFPSAPSNSVTCNNYFADMNQNSPKDESGVLKAVQNVHAMIDKEIAAGTDPNNVFVCGFSQGGALTLASVLLYPKTLGGGAVFSGWVPFSSSMTPILWSHGMADRTVLFETGQAGPPFLVGVGVSCEFKAYPGLGHSISNEELRYLESWIKTRMPGSS
ncbi:putative carboxylesterase sober1-like [Quercus suber]|uniref:Carboxylesterase sober1-like n=1 Tax=Quercus suber TaxID=58331 RepID=A0AAW0KMZ4_QUESU